MDISTIVGISLSVLLVIFGIIEQGVSLSYYFDFASILIVFGGSIGGTIAASTPEILAALPKYLRIPFANNAINNSDTIKQMVSFAEKARREGLLALEDSLSEIQDEFMKSGIQLVVDGTDPEIIKSILYNEINQVESRHEKGIAFFNLWGTLAPAFGMLGTLIGLIAMLSNLQDSEGLASGMSTALITTMYGSLLANVFLIPFARTLEEKHRVEMLSKEMLIEGVLSIQSGDNPRTLQQKLSSFLSPRERQLLRVEMGES